MNSRLAISLGILAVVGVVVVGLAAGWALWGRHLWSDWAYAMGPGMMGGSDVRLESSSDSITIDDAHEAFERYIGELGYSGLEIAEVMEFENNFYAIVRESDTGIGAMELLVDKRTGNVGPEPGPNMMWNARYGMHGGGMMGGSGGYNTLMPEEALEIGQRWLDTTRPGVTVEAHTDPFYGYYTIHTLRDGEIEGMLSVHGSSGQVWYHSWHGAFVQMVEADGRDH